jgi:protein subunit release factor A
MDPIELPESDEDLLAQCDVQTFHASGKGGQSVNTSDSAVRMRHRPSGVVVVCRRERSQLLNKRACLARLRAKIAALNETPEPRVPTAEPKRVKRAVRESKVRQSRTKRLRARPSDEDD